MFNLRYNNFKLKIGRVGRFGTKGISISFCEATEVKFLKNIEKFIKIKIPIKKEHPYHVVHTKEIIDLEEKKKKELKSERLKSRKSSRPKKRNSQNARFGGIKTKKKTNHRKKKTRT